MPSCVDDGASHGDHLEQLAYLIFRKMADEYATPPHNRYLCIATTHNWEILRSTEESKSDTSPFTPLHMQWAKATA